MKYINLGYAAGEIVSMSSDFKFVKIGKDKQQMSKSSIDELSSAMHSEQLRVCIKLFNQEREGV